MTEEDRKDNKHEPASAPARPVRWHHRPTIHALKRRADTEASELREEWDRRDNDETRLPATETVHLGGLVLVETFTPSTVSGLYRALKNWPADSSAREKLLAELIEGRRGGRGGWQNYGLVRRSNNLLGRNVHHDPRLPDGVAAVWLHFNYTIPSLTTVVATFTLTEEAGDLSALLRHDYQMKPRNVRVRVYGRAAWLRERIPWARPVTHGLSYGISRAKDEKTRTCAEMIRHHQEACERWFFDWFSGRFSIADPKDRPVMRLLFTTEQVPFTDQRTWLRPVALEQSADLWRSTGPSFPGWALSLGHWPYYDGQHTLTLAARRRDAAKEPNRDESGESNWHLTYRFGAFQAPLAARYALTALLAIYGDRLGSLRDRAGVKHHLRRPVREARELDCHLIGDGLDSATITADVRVLTEDLVRFRSHVPEYEADMSAYPPDQREERKPEEFASLLCESLNDQARRLAEDTAITTGNIRASAELRQAIANTRLQRIVLVVSVLAAAVAVISLMVATG